MNERLKTTISASIEEEIYQGLKQTACIRGLTLEEVIQEAFYLYLTQGRQTFTHGELQLILNALSTDIDGLEALRLGYFGEDRLGPGGEKVLSEIVELHNKIQKLVIDIEQFQRKG